MPHTAPRDKLNSIIIQQANERTGEKRASQKKLPIQALQVMNNKAATQLPFNGKSIQKMMMMMVVAMKTKTVHLGSRREIYCTVNQHPKSYSSATRKHLSAPLSLLN
jgi:hypothetical protein